MYIHAYTCVYIAKSKTFDFCPFLCVLFACYYLCGTTIHPYKNNRFVYAHNLQNKTQKKTYLKIDTFYYCYLFGYGYTNLTCPLISRVTAS